MLTTFTLKNAGHEWKLPVRAAILILSASCAAQNAASTAVSLGLGGSLLSSSVQGGAVFVFILFILTAIILLAGFGYSVFESAARAKAEAAAEAAAASAVTFEATAAASRDVASSNVDAVSMPLAELQENGMAGVEFKEEDPPLDAVEKVASPR